MDIRRGTGNHILLLFLFGSHSDASIGVPLMPYSSAMIPPYFLYIYIDFRGG